MDSFRIDEDCASIRKLNYVEVELVNKFAVENAGTKSDFRFSCRYGNALSRFR